MHETYTHQTINSIETDAEFSALIGQMLHETHETGEVTLESLRTAGNEAYLMASNAKLTGRIDQADKERLRAGIRSAYKRAARDLGNYPL